MKKIKLNKKFIVDLDGGEMNQLRGGITGLAYLCPAGSQNFCNTTYTYDSPTTNINDCPYYSQVGSGCNGETCGWAYTCNG
jgi:hypothetical protein